uniref:uncharacterized protein n=1 Tax=Myxine glutinosa TaxID=7769 RepID=UPI00358E1E0C
MPAKRGKMGRPAKAPQRDEDTVPDLPAGAPEEVVFDPEAIAAEASGSKAADIQDVEEVALVTEVAKKPAKDTVILTEEQEYDMVEWVLQNPLFYDKSMTSFREKAKKQALWVAKASEIGRSDDDSYLCKCQHFVFEQYSPVHCSSSITHFYSLLTGCNLFSSLSVDDLKQWLRSQCTKFSKLSTQGRSGDGAKVHTDREKWTLERFAFLGKHVVRQSKKAGATLKRKIAASQLPPPEVPYAVPVPAAPVSAPLADDDILETIVEDPLSRASTPIPSSQPQTTPQAPATKKRKRHSDDSTVTRLEERARTSAELQQEIRAHLREAAVPTCPRVAWGRWITTLLPSIHESIWSDFMRDSINLMIRYSDASQRLHHQPQVMVQQQMPAQMPVTPQQMPQTSVVPPQQTMMAPIPPPAITAIYPAPPLTSQLVWDSTTPTFGAPVATTVPQSPGGAENITPLSNISAFVGLSRLLGSFAADTVGMSTPNLPPADDDDDSGSQGY